MNYIQIIETEKTKKIFYITMIKKIVKNLLKLYNETNINEKHAVLSVLTDILPKRILRKEGFIFSNTMHRTAKRKYCENEIIDETNLQIAKKHKESKKEFIINQLKLHSEKSSKLLRNNAVYNLQESKLFIYKKIKKEHPEIELSMSKFYSLCPKYFQYSKKKTDMCDICIHGKKLIKKKGNENEFEKIEYYKIHLKLNGEQKKNFKEKLNSLKEKECLLIMDFKENFKIGGGPVESSQIFYNKSQVSCLGLCLIYKKGNTITIFRK